MAGASREDGRQNCHGERALRALLVGNTHFLLGNNQLSSWALGSAAVGSSEGANVPMEKRGVEKDVWTNEAENITKEVKAGVSRD